MSGNLVWRPRATTVALRSLRVQGSSTSGGSNIRCPVAAGTHGVRIRFVQVFCLFFRQLKQLPVMWGLRPWLAKLSRDFVQPGPLFD